MDRDGSTGVWLALLRGVNVGGANRVPMAGLRALVEGLGWTDVRSYIASGNLVFRASGDAQGLAAGMRAAMAQAFDVDVPVLVLPAPALVAAREACPFDPQEGRHVHGFFTWTAPVVDAPLLDSLIAPSERFELCAGVAWLHAPDGIARSKLAGRMGHVLGGAEVTARNLNTVDRLAHMVADG